jgi:hypothetical protein
MVPIRRGRGHARAEIVGQFKALAVFFADFFLTISRAALQLRVHLGRE